MKWKSVSQMNCSVARTLSVVGERWTMLILREAFLGRRRFDQFQTNTGVARNILSTRLRALVRDGIFQRSKPPDAGGHVEYRLTKKGMDLYPVLAAMLRWGDVWLAGEKGPPMTLVHRTCGAKTTPTMMCSHCGRPLVAREMLAVPRRVSRPAHRAERRSAVR
jgi:DNA-binding HxlR family transcriptional regulator